MREFSNTSERLQSGTKLFIRVYLQKGDAEPKFVGCMSFGARKIIQEMSIIKVKLKICKKKSILNSPELFFLDFNSLSRDGITSFRKISAGESISPFLNRPIRTQRATTRRN